MRSVEEHQKAISHLFPERGETRIEIKRIDRALGYVTARPIIAPIALPPFTNSAMDGYALRSRDVDGATPDHPITLPVIGDIPAGLTEIPTLQPGTALRIMTGAPVPDGADTVIQVEKTDGGTDKVNIFESSPIERNIRHAGSDTPRNEQVMPAGTRLGPSQIGLLAALGIDAVPVWRKIRVLVLSTGSELIAPGKPLAPGHIYESNAPMLAAAVEEAGGVAEVLSFVPDDVDEFIDTLDRHVEDGDIDVVVTTGGVSAGAYEVVKDALTDNDRSSVEFVKVQMQPGMPQGCGRYSSSAGHTVSVVTLPGNPVSAQVSFEIFIRNPLRFAQGLIPNRKICVAKLTESLTSPSGKRQFRRGVLSQGADGSYQVKTIGPPASHHLRWMASANCLLDIAADIEILDVGTNVDVISLEVD